jgi:hypothetical protein
MFRICWEFSVMFRICWELSAMFRICSEFSVMFRICSEFPAIFRIFRICSEFSAMFRIWSLSKAIGKIVFFIQMKEVYDYEKKVKIVMVNNSTNINHHSLKHKKGGNTIWCWKCRSWLGTEYMMGSEKMHCNRVHQWPLQTIDACVT